MGVELELEDSFQGGNVPVIVSLYVQSLLDHSYSVRPSAPQPTPAEESGSSAPAPWIKL